MAWASAWVPLKREHPNGVRNTYDLHQTVCSVRRPFLWLNTYWDTARNRSWWGLSMERIRKCYCPAADPESSPHKSIQGVLSCACPLLSRSLSQLSPSILGLDADAAWPLRCPLGSVHSLKYMERMNICSLSLINSLIVLPTCVMRL